MTIGTVEASFIIFAAANIGTLIWREGVATERSKSDRERYDSLRADFVELKDKVEHVLSNGTFVRASACASTTNQLNERLERFEATVEKQFERMIEQRAEDNSVLTARLNDQSSRLLKLAEAVGARFARPDMREMP